MRVLITTGIFPPDVGGPATFVPHLATALHNRTNDVTVVTLSDSGKDVDHPFPVVRIPRTLPLLRRFPEAVTRIARAARSSDVLFANGLFDETAIAVATTGIPWVAKIVGDWVWERARNRGWTTREILDFQNAPPLRTRWHRTIQRWVVMRPGQIIVPSSFLRRLVLGWGVEAHRITVIPNAVDHPQLPPREEAKRRLGLHGIVVLFVGRLVSWKHVDGILQATVGIPVEVVIVGDGPERTALQRLADRIGSSARFVGARPEKTTREYFAAADIFVLNSTYEGFPHVILEAMVAGAAVVATSAGGTPEVVEHDRTGLLVPCQDPRALRGAIERLVSDPSLRTSLAEQARAHARRFAWDDVGNRVLEVLKNVARGPTSKIGLN